MNEEQKIREAIKNIVEKLCKKGQAYRRKRMAAGEKSSAYLSGRAVKVCKGQMQGESALEKSKKGMAMYGKKAKMNEQDSLEIDVYGYQTQHFDVCPGAQSLYKRIVDEDLVENKDLVVRTAKLQDALFALEKTALEDGATNLDVEAAQLLADQIMEMAKMMGLDREHMYIQGHVEKIKGAMGSKMNEADVEVDDDTTFQLSLKHLLDKHIIKKND